MLTSFSKDGVEGGMPVFGAEHVVPWFIDACFSGISAAKKLFSPQELSVIVEMCRDVPDGFVPQQHAQYLMELLRGDAAVSSAAANGVNIARLEKKAAQLVEMQAGVLLLWARSFRKGPASAHDDTSRYVSAG